TLQCDLKSFQNDMWQILRYILSHFYIQEGTRDHLALHLKPFSPTRRHARSSCVTSQAIFTYKTAREIILRYISSHFHMQDGTQDRLALHLKPFSPARRHARSSCVTSQTIFTYKMVREIILRYISSHLSFPPKKDGYLIVDF